MPANVEHMLCGCGGACVCHTVCVQFDPKVSHLRSSDLQLEVMRFEDMLAALTRDDINRAVSVIAGAYRRFRIRRRLWRFIYLYEKEVNGVLQCWRWRAALRHPLILEGPYISHICSHLLGMFFVLGPWLSRSFR